MMEMLSVFLFDEVFSKWVVKQKLLQMQSRELHVHFMFLSSFHVARAILLYSWIIITEFEFDNAFDFMYKFS